MPATRPVHHQGRPGGRGCPGVRGSLSNTAFASSASVGQGHTREGGGWRPRPGGRSRHHRPRGLQAGRPGPRPRRGQCLPQVPERLLTVTSRGGRGEGLRGVRHEDARPIVGPHPQDLGTSQRPRRLTPPRRGSGVSTWIWGHGHWVCKRLLDHFGLGVPRGQRQRRCPPGSWKLLAADCAQAASLTSSLPRPSQVAADDLASRLWKTPAAFRPATLCACRGLRGPGPLTAPSLSGRARPCPRPPPLPLARGAPGASPRLSHLTNAKQRRHRGPRPLRLILSPWQSRRRRQCPRLPRPDR